jgi:hypothetical protein
MKFIKKIIFSLVVLSLVYSCGGGDDPAPTPTPEENKPPTTPTQIYPASNDLCINNTVNFQWNASTDPEGNAISYIIEVAENNSFSPLIESKTVSTTSTTISLSKGVAYYWRVTAKDSKNESSSPSTANGFYTEGTGVSNYVPFSPELVSPTLGEIIQTATATLEWTASDVDNDALTYDVYVGSVNPPTTLVSQNQSTNSYTIDPLTVSKTYYWKIVVKDNKGGQTIGQVWNFITD